MAIVRVPAVRPSGPRLRWWGAAGAVVGVLVLGGFLGRPWFQEWLEVRKALQLADEQQFDAARPLLLAIHERHPDQVAVVRALALGYLHNTRDLAATRTYLDCWCRLQPGQSEPFRRRLGYWMMQEMVAPAIADAEHILQLEADDRETRGLLVQLLLTDGRYEQAEQEGLRCFQDNPKDVKLWLVLANIYHGLARGSQGASARGKAAALTDEVLRARPDDLAALKLRARLYLEEGQPERAIRLLKERVIPTPSPDGTEGLYELSEALTRAGRHEEARRVLAELEWRQALGMWYKYQRRDDNPGLQERVVKAMLAAGKTEEAVGFLTDILQRNRQAPPGTHELLALCYERQGQAERAATERRLAQRARSAQAKTGRAGPENP